MSKNLVRPNNHFSLLQYFLVNNLIWLVVSFGNTYSAHFLTLWYWCSIDHKNLLDWWGNNESEVTFEWILWYSFLLVFCKLSYTGGDELCIFLFHCLRLLINHWPIVALFVVSTAFNVVTAWPCLFKQKHWFVYCLFVIFFVVSNDISIALIR